MVVQDNFNDLPFELFFAMVCHPPATDSNVRSTLIDSRLNSELKAADHGFP